MKTNAIIVSIGFDLVKAHHRQASEVQRLHDQEYCACKHQLTTQRSEVYRIANIS